MGRVVMAPGRARTRRGPGLAAASRPFRTLTLSPRCEALLTLMSERTGMARGRIVDLAIEAIGVCEACDGSGTEDGPLGPSTRVCPVCGGSRVVPCA